MQRLRGALVALLATATVIVLGSGCGASSPQSQPKYERAMQREGKRVDTALVKLKPDAQPPDVRDVRDIAQRLDASVESMNAIDAPNAVTSAHTDLIEGVRLLSTSVAGLADSLEQAHSNAQREQAFRSFPREKGTVEAYQHIERARTAFDKQGYVVLS